MTANPSLRRLLPWVAVVLLSLAVACGAIELASVSAEQNYKSALETEVRRRALVLDGITLSSNVMGSVAALGLINQTAKGVARGVTPLDHPSIMETLQAIGESYQANGVYLVGSNGIVQSCWYTIGVTLTGVDVKFRPYFQIAMKGKQNVYAAIGTTTSERALYFAAPLYEEATTRSAIIGAAVARLDAGRIDTLLSAWTSGPALLLSPQGLTYASNRAELNERLAVEPTAEQLKAIRELKQFGKKFDAAAPGTLPFDIGRETASFERRRYAVARAPVQWNDPSGEWKLVLLGDLDESMPAGRRAAIGAAGGALALVLGSLFLVWRRRLARANAQRESAQAELKANAGRLESDSADKSYLAGLSDDLHRAASIAEFARKFMFHVAPRVAAEYGVFYVPDDDGRQLIPVGSHGASTGELEKVAIGQGLVGQCAKDLAPIVISDSRDTPIRIVWGAGTIAPKSILLLPVVQAGRLMGVILLASLREMAADKRALLDAMLPMVAMNLEIMERNVATQRQSELLQGQQARLKETEAWYRSIVESVARRHAGRRRAGRDHPRQSAGRVHVRLWRGQPGRPGNRDTDTCGDARGASGAARRVSAQRRHASHGRVEQGFARRAPGRHRVCGRDRPRHAAGAGGARRVRLRVGARHHRAQAGRRGRSAGTRAPAARTGHQSPRRRLHEPGQNPFRQSGVRRNLRRQARRPLAEPLRAPGRSRCGARAPEARRHHQEP